MSDTAEQNTTRRRVRGGGGAARRAERTAVVIETARFIERNIPNFEVLNEKALKILEKVSKTFNVPTVTDIHEVSDADLAAQYVDVLQIPAFLCRQTDLLRSAAETGKVIKVKKDKKFCFAKKKV